MSADRLALARLPPIESQPHQRPVGISAKNAKFEGLTGVSYHLTGTSGGNPKYPLPPPGALKPYHDTKAGTVETWPAHATGQIGSGTSVALTKNKSLVVYNDEDMGKPQIIPKPRFLDQLESFLKKELRSLGVTEVGPSELRLQAHREVFEYLIEDFKTYKPLLSSIKNEYEMMLAYQREIIRQMDPLRQMLVTVSEQCDQKIMALREQEKQEMVDLKKENSGLFKKISDLKNEMKDLETTVDKLKVELSAEYLKYRDECDARKLLVSDINDLRYQQEDIALSKQGMQDLDEEEIDPVMLKIALKKAREDEAAASIRLNEMVANYSDVIPRRDYEALEAKYRDLEERLGNSQLDMAKLQEEHDTLLEVHKQVLSQRDEYYTECETLRRSATPRPDWDKCADYVQGGIVRWKELSDGKTSDEKVEALLNEIAGGNVGDIGGSEFFDGKGSDESVPRHLRFDGKVRNRRLGKRDCALLIKDLWKEKAESDKAREDGTRDTMASFLFDYLQKRFGIEQMMVEWAYNLQDASERFAHDDRIGTFFGILTGAIEEDVYHSQYQAIAKLAGHLHKVEEEKGSEGSIPKDILKVALMEYFQKDEDAVTPVFKAAEQELDAKEAESVEYKNLFMEDDEGKTGLFLDEVKKLLKQERLDYVEDIRQELASANLEKIEVNDLRKALTAIDPEISQQQMESYISWAYTTTKDHIDEASPLDLSRVVERLQNGNIHRVGKKA